MHAVDAIPKAADKAEEVVPRTLALQTQVNDVNKHKTEAILVPPRSGTSGTTVVPTPQDILRNNNKPSCSSDLHAY